MRGIFCHAYFLSGGFSYTSADHHLAWVQRQYLLTLDEKIPNIAIFWHQCMDFHNRTANVTSRLTSGDNEI